MNDRVWGLNLPFRRPGLDPGSSFFFTPGMDRETSGGWAYIMANRYRGTMYVGVTADLPTRINQHREGTGSDFCARYGLRRLVWADRLDTVEAAMAQEKRLKRWHRAWKFELIEKHNPQWDDLFASLV